MSMTTVPLGELMPSKKRSIDPRKNPDEEFELFSIPAFDIRTPEVICGTDIGSSKQILERGDVLLAKIVPHIRRSWVVEPSSDRPTIGSSEWIIFRSDRFDPSYLRHVLVSDRFHQAFMQTVAGVGGSLLRARPSHVASIEIPLPSVEEQRRIAAVLDAAEAIRVKRRESLSKLHSLTQAIFIDMFGNAVAPESEWPRECLADIVAEGTTVTYGIVQAGDEFPGGVPYIRTGDIVDGRIQVDGLRRTDPVVAERFPRSRVRLGEIVMSIRATVGTTAIVPAELDGSNLTQGTARISPGEEVVGRYLLEYLRSDLVQRWIRRQVKGATFREITLTRLRELPVLVPPLYVQHEFARMCKEADQLRVAVENSLRQFDMLLASLEQRAFRGEL